jgi:hypothetical protein
MSSIEMLCAGLDDLIQFAKEIRAPIRSLSLVELARADLQAEIERESPLRLVEIGLKAKK